MTKIPDNLCVNIIWLWLNNVMLIYTLYTIHTPNSLSLCISGLCMNYLFFFLLQIFPVFPSFPFSKAIFSVFPVFQSFQFSLALSIFVQSSAKIDTFFYCLKSFQKWMSKEGFPIFNFWNCQVILSTGHLILLALPF